MHNASTENQWPYYCFMIFEVVQWFSSHHWFCLCCVLHWNPPHPPIWQFLLQNCQRACCENDICSTKSSSTKCDCSESLHSVENKLTCLVWRMFPCVFTMLAASRSFKVVDELCFSGLITVVAWPVNVKCINVCTVHVKAHHVWKRVISQCDCKWKLRKWHQEVIQPPSIDFCLWASGQWWNMERIPVGRRGLYASKHWLLNFLCLSLYCLTCFLPPFAIAS